MPAAIVATGITKAYKSRVRALVDFSLSVEKGTVFALLGPNGAGKSTAVKILSTLALPDSGRASVAGLDVVLDAPRVRRLIGVVGQRPGFDRDATGRENVVLQGELFDLHGAVLRRRVSDLFDRLGLSQVADRVASTYSGGMQRRLDIALGLIHQPSVLFLDEPTAGLDPDARANLWREIARLASEDDITVLLTTHYLDEAEQLAHELAIIHHGRVVVRGSPEKLKIDSHEDTIELTLASLYPWAYLREILAPYTRSASCLDGRTVRLRVSDGAQTAPRLVATLDRAGVSLISVKTSRPSLDDVYLRYVGHDASQSSASA